MVVVNRRIAFLVGLIVVGSLIGRFAGDHISPALTLDAPGVIDLGRVAPGERIAYDLVLANPNRYPLTLRKFAGSCGCIIPAAAGSEVVIERGNSTTLRLEISTGSERSPLRQYVAFEKVYGRASAIHRIEVVADRSQALQPTPGEWLVYPDDVEQDFVLTPSSDKVEFASISVVCSLPYLNTRIISAPNDSLILRCTATRPFPYGEIAGEISVIDSEAKQLASMDIGGRFRGERFATPSLVSLSEKRTECTVALEPSLFNADTARLVPTGRVIDLIEISVSADSLVVRIADPNATQLRRMVCGSVLVYDGNVLTGSIPVFVEASDIEVTGG